MTAPSPDALADEFERAAALLRTKGLPAVKMADVLAARGWPSHGDRGTKPRDNDCAHVEGECECGVTLTSTEAAASTSDAWKGIDTRYAHLRTLGYRLTVDLQVMIGNLTSHSDPEATDRPNRQSGAGHCEACGDYCSGAVNDRLRAGLDDKCRKAWERITPRPDRTWWVRRRREELAGQNTTVHIDPTVAGSVP